MGSISFAISIHKFVSSTGADAGFAAIIGLAILILLYFAQARETATLREQAAEAAGRVGAAGGPDRRARAPGARGRRAAAPRRPRPAAMRAAATGGGRREGGARPRVHIGPPAGVAAPALAAATRLIPLPTDNGVRRGRRVGRRADQGASRRDRQAPPSPAAGGNGHGRLPRCRRATGGGSSPLRAARGARPGAAPRRPLLPPEPPPRRRSRGREGAVRAARPARRRRRRGSGADRDLEQELDQADHRRLAHHEASRGARQRVSFNPRSVTVSVLNGTGTTGLAHRTALRLTGAGFRQGTVATATDQTLTATQVALLPGFKRDASRVAAALKLPSGAVQPIDPGTRAVACPPPTACTAERGRDRGLRSRDVGLSFIELPRRSAKPREQGLTHVLDKGLSLAEVDGLIEVAGDSVDIVKLGWGTALATGEPRAQARPLRASTGFPVVLGGTLTELAIAQDRLEELIDWVGELGLRHFEISDGTIALDHGAQARADRAAGRELHGPLRGRLQGRHGRDHAALPVGRDDGRGARGRRLEGDRRGTGGGHGRDLPPHRRGPRGPDRRDRPRHRLGADHVRRAAQAPAGVVRAPLRARRQPRQHRARRRPAAGDAASGPALGHARHRPRG